MIKDVLRQLDYSLTAQISLIMFFTIFVVVTVRALMQNRQQSRECANVIFDEDMEGHQA